MRILLSLVFILFTTSSFAVTFDGKFIQGTFILGRTEPGSEVFIDKKKIKVTSDGYFAFGLGRDRRGGIFIRFQPHLTSFLKISDVRWRTPEFCDARWRLPRFLTQDGGHAGFSDATWRISLIL